MEGKMRKEDLLNKKNETAENLQWYVRDVITDEDLKCFSIPQLERLILSSGLRHFAKNVQVFVHYQKMKLYRRVQGKLHILKIPEKSGKKLPKNACRELLDKGISIT